MKINERNLISFAAAHTPVDREGWLETRSDPTRPYTRRWFVLKGNLLFSFDKRGDREPVALLILEGCTIELSEEEYYSFKIVFHCEGGRTYFLCTDSQSSMEAWMKALGCASYDYMKLMVADLQRQLEEAEAEAEALSKSQSSDEPKVPPRGQRYNPFNKTGESSTGKIVQGSRHNRDAVRGPDTARSKMSFLELHSSYGLRILADRNHWKNSTNKHHTEAVPALIQL